MKLVVIDGYEAKPCVGSGYCCKTAPCELGLKLHGPVAPCPSLTFQEGRYWCQQILNATGAERETLIEGLAIGAGCCSPLNSDRKAFLSD